MKLETKVGIFFIIGIIMLFALSTQVGSFSLSKEDAYKIDVQLDDVNGLEKNAKVKSRGINIGKVADFSLSKDNVVVTLNIKKGIKIPQDSEVSIKQESMLGVKYVEITFSNNIEILKKGDTLQKNTSYASFDQTSDTINVTAINLNKFIIRLDKLISQNEKNFTALLINFKDVGAQFKQTGITINDKLPKLMDEIYATSQEFKQTGNMLNKSLPTLINKYELLANEYTKTANTLNNDLPDLFKKYKDLADEFKKTGVILNNDLPNMINNYNNVATEFTKTAQTINKDLPSVFTKFKKAEDGVIGIIDDNRKNLHTTIQNIDDTFTEVKSASRKIKSSFDKIDKYLSSTTQSRLTVGFDTAYIQNDRYNKTNFSVDYSPKPTIHYLATLTSANDYRLGQSTNIHEDNRNLVTAQYAKDFNNYRLRAGIIESTGGVGIDYFAKNKQLKLSLDAYDFNAYNDARGTKAHLRAIANYTIKKHIQVYTGYDNFLNKESRTVYFGLGVKFEDDDLKYLLGGAASLK